MSNLTKKRLLPEVDLLGSALSDKKLQGAVNNAYEVYRDKPYVEARRPIYLAVKAISYLLHFLSVLFALSFGLAVFYNIIAGAPLYEVGYNFEDWRLWISGAVSLIVLLSLELIKARTIKDTFRGWLKDKKPMIGFLLVALLLVGASIFSSFEGSQESAATSVQVDKSALKNAETIAAGFNTGLDSYRGELRALQAGERGFKFGWWTGGKIGKGAFALNKKGAKERDRLLSLIEAETLNRQSARSSAESHNNKLEAKAETRLAFIGGVLGYMSIGVEFFILLSGFYIQFYLYSVYVEATEGLSISPSIDTGPDQKKKKKSKKARRSDSDRIPYKGVSNKSIKRTIKRSKNRSNTGEDSGANYGETSLQNSPRNKERQNINYGETKNANFNGQDNSGKKYNTRQKIAVVKAYNKLLLDGGSPPSINGVAKEARVKWETAKAALIENKLKYKGQR